MLPNRRAEWPAVAAVPEAGDDCCDLSVFWAAEQLGRWYVVFTNESSVPLWIRSAFRPDVCSEFVGIEPAVLVSPGRTAIIDMRSFLPGLAAGDLAELTCEYLADHDLALAYVTGRWWVVRPPGASLAAA